MDPLQVFVLLVVFVLTIGIVCLAWFVLWHVVLRKLPFVQEMLRKRQKKLQEQAAKAQE